MVEQLRVGHDYPVHHQGLVVHSQEKNFRRVASHVSASYPDLVASYNTRRKAV